MMLAEASKQNQNGKKKKKSGNADKNSSDIFQTQGFQH